MKILVTVGSSPFNKLISAVDQFVSNDEYTVRCQISAGTYIPKKHKAFRFTSNFIDEIKQADLIITHGGAGTIYQLLELNKKFIVVPNTERIDNHQTDIANYITEKKLGLTCDNLDLLQVFIEKSTSLPPINYQKNPFFLTQSILSYFKE